MQREKKKETEDESKREKNFKTPVKFGAVIAMSLFLNGVIATPGHTDDTLPPTEIMDFLSNKNAEEAFNDLMEGYREKNVYDQTLRGHKLDNPIFKNVGS